MTEIFYNDKTLMPFGMHKGKMLGNVPSSYLLYLWDTSKKGETLYDKKLAAYMKNNLEAIKMQTIAEKQRKKYERY